MEEIDYSSDMIKVLFVVASNKVNGSEKIALDIAEGIDTKKFDVYFAIPMEGDISERLENKKIKKIVYNNGRLNTISFQGAKNLLKIIKKIKFDIIHAHSSSIPSLLGKIAGVKLKIETRHGLFYSDAELENLSKKRFFFEYSKKFYHDIITTVSENDKKRLVKYFKYDEDKLVNIYNGIDVKKLKSYSKKKSLENKSEIFLIGNVGRFTYQKNQELLLNVFSKLVEKFPKLRLQVIGDGELKNNLLIQIDELELSDYVEIVPYQKNIYEYIAKLDLMVMTSRFEGIPLVALEAMAIGTPVLSSNVGGMNEIIKDNETGILVSSFDENEFVDKISDLINNPEKLEKISGNALNYIQNFSVENMVKNYEELYLSHFKQ